MPAWIAFWGATYWGCSIQLAVLYIHTSSYLKWEALAEVTIYLDARCVGLSVWSLQYVKNTPKQEYGILRTWLFLRRYKEPTRSCGDQGDVL